MERREFNKRLGMFALVTATGTTLAACGSDGDSSTPEPTPTPLPPLPEKRFRDNRLVLSEPMLQHPTVDSVRVVWFTEFLGSNHSVRFGEQLDRQIEASTIKLSRMYEDASSSVSGRSFTGVTERDIWRHEAVVTGLQAGQRLRYVAVSHDGSESLRSDENTLQPLPQAGQRTRLLLTSDLQLKKMAAANYERVAETLAPIDGVLFAGDLVNVPNRASEWFDNGKQNEPPFFAALQGTMNKWQSTSTYTGGALLQNAWIFPILGNHEYSGRWLPKQNNLNTIFNDPQPKWLAEINYEKLAAQVNPGNDPAIKAQWIQDNSFETISYEEIFTLPEGPEGERYYAQRIGDIFLIAMDGNRIWRGWGANTKGKFSEAVNDVNDLSKWGFGDFQFWPFAKGSRQYEWLQEVLASDAFKTAKYKITMVHQSVFGLGDNATPVMSQTQASFEYEDSAGTLRTMGPFAFPISAETWRQQIQPVIDEGRMRYVKYDYPLNQDLWKTDIEPLLVEAGVQLVHVGHSHLWCRSQVGNMHYIETSNVGNSYGGYVEELTPRRSAAPTATQTANLTSFTWNPDDYPREGDPHDRPMAMPSLRNPMAELADSPAVPFLASNDITAYSVFDSSTGTVTSYAFDTRYPGRDPILFDEFTLR